MRIDALLSFCVGGKEAEPGKSGERTWRFSLICPHIEMSLRVHECSRVCQVWLSFGISHPPHPAFIGLARGPLLPCYWSPNRAGSLLRVQIGQWPCPFPSPKPPQTRTGSLVVNEALRERFEAGGFKREAASSSTAARRRKGAVDHLPAAAGLGIPPSSAPAVATIAEPTASCTSHKVNNHRLDWIRLPINFSAVASLVSILCPVLRETNFVSMPLPVSPLKSYRRITAKRGEIRLDCCFLSTNLWSLSPRLRGIWSCSSH